MLLTEKHSRQFALFYLACFLVYFIWSIYHGLLFSIIQPVFFLNKTDVTGNILMLTDLQHALLQYQWLRIGFDLTYLALPFLLAYACLKNHRFQVLFAFCTAGFSILYNYYFSIMSFVSIEVLVGWMLVPMIFVFRKPLSFYYAMHSVRILFIVFFFSTALWKIRAGGIGNMEQMSGILLSQHSAYMADSNDWFSQLIGWLVNHNRVSYSLYLVAFGIEFLFITGLFTRKYDRLLIFLFCLFAAFNYFLMEINYFTWLPFMGCLYFSKYKAGAR